MGNILQCWEHQADLEAIFEYDTYVSDATHEAVAAIDDLDTTSARLSEYSIDEELSVAVVGEPQLTPLERSILPAEYTSVSPFHSEAYDPTPFHVFDSKTDVVETVIDALSTETADDVAIVLDQASAYSSLIESGLESAGIPFYGGPGFIDNTDHRAYLSLLRVLNAGSDTRVREIRPLLTHLGEPPAPKHDDKRVSELNGGAISWVQDLRSTTDDHTFDDILAAFERRVGRSLDAFRTELQALGVAETTVTDTAVDQLAFYLQSYEVPVDRENTGVLLADATSAAYVGRPTVVHLGLDDGWTASPPNRPWVGREDQYTRNIDDFQLLLQSGRQQHYLVTDAEGGSPVTPALYFTELLESSFERFTDVEHVRHTTPDWTDGNGFDRDPTVVDTDIESVETISQSSLATYVNSPRDYMFSRLLDSPDREYFMKGNLLHDFAEFCVAHPAFVDSDVVDDAVELILDATRPFRRRVDEPTRRTEYRVALETIHEYIAETDPVGDPALGTADRWGENTFATHYGRPIGDAPTEVWFEEQDLGMKGKIDLVASPTELVDHKSGTTAPTETEIVRKSAIEPPHDKPDFQALLYLSYWRTQRPNEDLEFTFFHPLATLDEAVAGEAALEATRTTVSAYPTSFPDHVRSEAVFAALRDDGAGDCQKTLGKTTYSEWAAVFERATPPTTSANDEMIDSAFGQTLIEHMRDTVGEYKYVTSGCEQALRELARIYGRNYFIEDMDAFTDFVADQLTELNEYRRGAARFPVEGRSGEPNARRLDHEDLLLEGSR